MKGSAHAIAGELLDLDLIGHMARLAEATLEKWAARVDEAVREAGASAEAAAKPCASSHAALASLKLQQKEQSDAFRKDALSQLPPFFKKLTGGYRCMHSAHGLTPAG